MTKKLMFEGASAIKSAGQGLDTILNLCVLRRHPDRAVCLPGMQTLRNLAEQRLGEVEWGHHVDLASCGNEALEGRHRTGNRALAQEAHQADHCETAVINLNP